MHPNRAAGRRNSELPDRAARRRASAWPIGARELWFADKHIRLLPRAAPRITALFSLRTPWNSRAHHLILLDHVLNYGLARCVSCASILFGNNSVQSCGEGVALAGRAQFDGGTQVALRGGQIVQTLSDVGQRIRDGSSHLLVELRKRQRQVIAAQRDGGLQRAEDNALVPGSNRQRLP